MQYFFTFQITQDLTVVTNAWVGDKWLPDFSLVLIMGIQPDVKVKI